MDYWCRPCFVVCNNLIHSACFGQNWTMAGADKLWLYRQSFDLFQTFAYKGSKWTKDCSVIQFECCIICLWICDIGIKGIWFTVMTTQEVTGKQGLCILYPGKHRIWPMQVWCKEEGQNSSTQIQCFSVFYFLNIQIAAVGDIFQIQTSCLRSNDFCFWHQFQKFCHRTGVVWLIMIHDDVIDFFQRANLFDIFKVLMEKSFMTGFDQCGLFTALYNIGIVCCTGVSFHYNIKHPHIWVLDSNGINSFCDFNSGHFTSSFLNFFSS